MAVNARCLHRWLLARPMTLNQNKKNNINKKTTCFKVAESFFGQLLRLNPVQEPVKTAYKIKYQFKTQLGHFPSFCWLRKKSQLFPQSLSSLQRSNNCHSPTWSLSIPLTLLSHSAVPWSSHPFATASSPRRTRRRPTSSRPQSSQGLRTSSGLSQSSTTSTQTTPCSRWPQCVTNRNRWIRSGTIGTTVPSFKNAVSFLEKKKELNLFVLCPLAVSFTWETFNFKDPKLKDLATLSNPNFKSWFTI